MFLTPIHIFQKMQKLYEFLLRFNGKLIFKRNFNILRDFWKKKKHQKHRYLAMFSLKKSMLKKKDLFK